MHPAGIPAIRKPILVPRRHPGVPAGFSLIPGPPQPPATSFAAKGDGPPCSRHDRRRCQHLGIPEDPVGGIMPVIKDQITALRRHNA
jgi:hypothetical protein